MELLITGSTGFIGTRLQKQFKEKYNIKNFSFLQNDFQKLKLSGVDVVVHLSALVHQMKKEPTYKQYHDVNVQNTIDLAKKAKERGVKQFVFMSTIAVYGENSENVSEISDLKPITPYGKSKLKAEEELQKIEEESFIVSIIRPPMIYGDNAPGNTKSLINIVKIIPILPFADIKNKRSFVYIGNLCYMIDKIIETRMGGVFLAADDKPISTTELIMLISKAMGKKRILVKIPFFEKVLKILKPSIHKKLYGNLVVDNSATKERLNFRNRYSTEEGIRLMIKGL